MLEVLFSGSLLGTCLVAIVTGLLVYWFKKNWKYNYPPGPRGWPVIGNTNIDSKKMYEDVFKLSKKYGPVLSLRIGLMDMVFVNNIDTAMEVLVKKSTDFAARMSVPSTDIMSYGGKDIIFGSYGPTWKLHRRIASKALRQYMQGDALQTRIYDAINPAFVEMDKLTGEFDPSEYLSFIVVNILTGLCFGGQYSFGDKEIRSVLQKDDEINDVMGNVILEDFVPGLKYVYKTQNFRRIEELTKDVIEDYIRRKYKEVEKSFNRDNIRHFTDHLILARLEAVEEEGKGVADSLTEDHVIQTLDDIFFAGIDTSRMTLGIAITHMIAFPDIQQKVQDEIDRVVGKDRFPRVTDRPDLSYTEAVLHESMRLGTVAPLGLMHMASCDSEVGGYKIPKGTNVFINQWALHHDPDAWEEVDRFIPERFLDENGKLGPKPKNWLPFSAGKRVCLGEFVAKPELHLLFASLMQRYKWKMVSGKCADIEPGGYGFVCFSKPHKVIIEKRE